MNRRIVLAGPESTGKTTLAEHLARTFGVPLASEYARMVLEEHGPAYDYDLLLLLSRGHRAHQRERVPESAPLGVFDTDLINYRIWCDVVYGRCHAEILDAMEAETNHAYLLCYPDLPWQPDPLRESESELDRLYELHVREIERLGRPYEVIRGVGPARVECAEAAFRRLCDIGG